MPEDIDLQSMTRAINAIDDFSAIGATDLARLAVVESNLRALGLSETPFQRGRILSRIIRDEIAHRFNEYQGRPSGRDVAEWTILYLRVHDGRSVEDIARLLHMPVRSVGRYYSRAKRLLLDRLYELDAEFSTGLHCLLCGCRLDTHADALPASLSCPRCKATSTIAQGDDHTLRVSVQPAHHQ